MYTFEEAASKRHEHLAGVEIAFRSIGFLFLIETLAFLFAAPFYQKLCLLCGAALSFVLFLLFTAIWMLTSIYVGLICIDRLGFLAKYKYCIPIESITSHEAFWYSYFQKSQADFQKFKADDSQQMREEKRTK